MEASRDAGLEQAIRANRHSRAAWLAYAQWLSHQGDPWGDRIRLAVERDHARDPTDLAQIDWYAEQLDLAHREYFLGPLASPPPGLMIHQSWSCGLLDALEVRGPTLDPIWLASVLTAPAARFLRRLLVEVD